MATTVTVPLADRLFSKALALNSVEAGTLTAEEIWEATDEFVVENEQLLQENKDLEEENKGLKEKMEELKKAEGPPHVISELKWAKEQLAKGLEVLKKYREICLADTIAYWEESQALREENKELKKALKEAKERVVDLVDWERITRSIWKSDSESGDDAEG